MNLPYVNNVKSRGVSFTQEFRGYNHNLRTEQGEFYDMENISLDDYPVIGTRKGIGKRRINYLLPPDYVEKNPNGLHEYKENTLMAVYGSTLYINITEDSEGELVPESSWALSDSEKTFATIGNKTLIMPDKVVYEHKPDGSGDFYNVEREFLWQTYESNPSDVHLMLRTLPCDIDGKIQASAIYESYNTEPQNPAIGMWWYCGDDVAWYEYKEDEGSGSWEKIEKPYTKLIPVLSTDASYYTRWDGPLSTITKAERDIAKINEFFDSLKVLDSVNLKKCSEDQHISIDNAEDADYVVYGKDQWHDSGWNIDLNALIIAGNPETNLVYYELKIKCPELKHIFAMNNRIWGVTPNQKYDTESGTMVSQPQEIFACKLGDLTQWYNYANTAADSFAVSLGNDNEVTAGCAFNNTPHFFTEDSIIKIYGDYPSNYQLRSNKADGVVAGGHKTLVQLEGVLMWVSPIGVVMYDGSQPYFRGDKFSPHYLAGKTVVAGKDGAKYVLSVTDGDGEVVGTYAYDTINGLWTYLCDKVMLLTAELKNALCFIDDSGLFCTMIDRDKDKDDDVGGIYGPILNDLEYRSAAESFVIDYDKYYTSIAADESGNIYFEEPQCLTYGSVGVYEGEQAASVSATTDYWNEVSNPFKNFCAGVGIPLPVIPGRKYVVQFKGEVVLDDAQTENEGKPIVYALVFDQDGNAVPTLDPCDHTMKKRIQISNRVGLVMPDSAETLILILGQYHVQDPDYIQYYMLQVYETDATEEKEIDWSLETGNLGLDSPYQKYISRIQLRADFIGSFMVDISYDDSEYLPVHVSNSDHMHSITVPIKVRRNDHFKIRMRGTGKMRLYSFGYETDEGSARCLI